MIKFEEMANPVPLDFWTFCSDLVWAYAVTPQLESSEINAWDNPKGSCSVSTQNVVVAILEDSGNLGALSLLL